MPGWLPIETAPKDGRWILVFVPPKYIPKGANYVHRVSVRIMSVKWSKPPPDLPMRTIGKRAHLMDAMYDGYWTAHPKGTRPLYGLPSHWMPCPELPEWRF